jgi:hypothetical protein
MLQHDYQVTRVINEALANLAEEVSNLNELLVELKVTADDANYMIVAGFGKHDKDIPIDTFETLKEKFQPKLATAADCIAAGLEDKDIIVSKVTFSTAFLQDRARLNAYFTRLLLKNNIAYLNAEIAKLNELPESPARDIALILLKERLHTIKPMSERLKTLEPISEIPEISSLDEAHSESPSLANAVDKDRPITIDTALSTIAAEDKKHFDSQVTALDDFIETLTETLRTQLTRNGIFGLVLMPIVTIPLQFPATASLLSYFASVSQRILISVDSYNYLQPKNLGTLEPFVIGGINITLDKKRNQAEEEKAPRVLYHRETALEIEGNELFVHRVDELIEQVTKADPRFSTITVKLTGSTDFITYAVMPKQRTVELYNVQYR